MLTAAAKQGTQAAYKTQASWQLLSVSSVTQLCLTLCDPMDCSPPGFSVHGDSPGKNTGVSCHSLLQGIFPTQRLNPSLLLWQVDSLPLSHSMAFRERFLLIGWWWGNLESQSKAFSFQPVWGLHACGQHTVNFFSLVGDSVSAKELKGFGSVSKESACSAGDPGSIPGLGRSPGEGNGNTLQYLCLENLMDRKAWWAAVHGVAKSRDDWATNTCLLIIFRPWGGTDHPWLCLMPNLLLLLCLVWLFSFVSTLSQFSD